MTQQTTNRETEREREERLAIARAHDILRAEGIPAALHFLEATAEYLRRWFDTPVDDVGKGALPADAWEPGIWPTRAAHTDAAAGPARWQLTEVDDTQPIKLFRLVRRQED